MVTKGNYLYSRYCKSWRADNEANKRRKLGCTNWIEYRKWMCTTDLDNPNYYEGYIVFHDLGQFKSIRSAEQTIFQHPFFADKRIVDEDGSGTEFFDFPLYEQEILQKMCEIVVQYDAKVELINGDPFPNKIKKPIEEIPDDLPLPSLTQSMEIEAVGTIEARPYQEKCLMKMLTVMAGIIVAATGIGKTVIMCLYMQKVGGKYLIIVPSKTLVNQTVKTCRKILGKSFTVYAYNRYSQRVLSKKENIVVVGLYQSSHKLVKLKGLECIIYDECHSTVVLNPPKDKNGKLRLSMFQKLLRYDCKKFFFTATEKNIVSESEDRPIDMTKEDIYGPVIFRYDLASAVKDGWLCDYLFHLVATDNKLNSCIKYVKSSSKTVIFCGKQKTVEEVYKKLCKELPTTIKVCKLGEPDDIQISTNLFSEYKGRAVLVACRKITMGYDEPQIDTIIHFDLSTSSIMTHQRNGRAFRLHKYKIMARLIFLCDISGNDDDRKKKIRQLHRPVAYLKEMDSRFENRLEKEKMKSRGEFKTIDVIVEGNFDVTESREVYDRCWRVVEVKTTYSNAKDIIRLSKPRPNSWKAYLDLCNKDSRLFKNPEEEYEGQFEDRVEYLGLERSAYVSLQKYKNTFSMYNTDRLKLTDICTQLEKQDMFPPVDLVIDMYGLNCLNDIISLKNTIKITEKEFDRIFN